MENELVKVVPMTAWEQAVIVVLFIMLIIGLLGWFSRQSDKWQKFMFDIDDKWRQFNREQREDNNSKMDDVEKSLQDLTTVTSKLVERVDVMVCRIYPEPVVKTTRRRKTPVKMPEDNACN